MKKGRSLLIEDLTGGLDPHAQPSELGRALEYAVNVGRMPLPEGVRVKRPVGWSEVQLSEPGVDKAYLIREAVETHVRIKSAKRLAALGGAAPQISEVSRHRTESEG